MAEKFIQKHMESTKKINKPTRLVGGNLTLLPKERLILEKRLFLDFSSPGQNPKKGSKNVF